MQQSFSWLIVVAVAATLIVLVVGVVSMLRQGKFNAKHSQKLMRYRVLFQFLAIALIGIAYLLSR
tara:strand:+ start:2063 stop:2257 length:195 start_codon:yes stop_codon:yes gene_type:complete